MRKATNIPVDLAYLALRHEKSKRAGYLRKAKWIEFCEAMLARGCRVSLNEDRRTASKYLTVEHGRRVMQARFWAGVCDLVVGDRFIGSTPLIDEMIEAAVAALGEPVAAT